ncbi:MAG: bifunctional demethylmenaquinone methyltransferase/2-methoxy-6-polyprenyl-1,4-benzoquinol methylase UbiE [Bacteroidetes bacterium]|nr:MAG: bifunctional demethylmenaquinone methyltransferase/2-methoxy-6-polyprenyl-1,4-benzoquinol methylase UbiE [Bacteroidota bacterium]REK08156.1 MAG: bifunctional demethylmenaquinone methyltransferase/2-methoxy-6-polyprenyl-1,4-benzoquinol methylase UbiE [Bacteroidota bacterium]REK32361.1 MAG: bifunctional demethylmenaquinone methyltransferase/2-methoxy-6-polyprenyl-1,4-benzoquinol methylase UbiE [Bacteroidota bacterium]REK49595.1 MAG: bifunctional demethylmenaquinone methyltransferase/2-meth
MSEPVRPYKDSKSGKKEQVAKMFDNIAWRYDFLNHLLSFGIDKYWRRSAIRELREIKPAFILDIATGTGDFALEAMRLKPEKIFGIDISADMLAIGKKKITDKKLTGRIELLEGDSENLIFQDNKFDAVIVAFGVRNFENLEKGLSEMLRVLRPGGKTVILEFSKPKSVIISGLYTFYSSKITPWIGKKLSKDPAAYGYLHESVMAFPEGETFKEILRKCGFNNVSDRRMTMGVVSVYTGTK